MIGAYMHNCTVVPRWFKFSVSVRDVNGTLKHTAEVSTKRMEPESGWGLASFCSKHTLNKVRLSFTKSLQGVPSARGPLDGFDSDLSKSNICPILL